MVVTPEQAWEIAVNLVLKIEGPMSDDSYDPGGLTKYGIAKAFHPNVDVANLTEAQALDIYRTEYWLAHKCDQMPFPVNIIVFDGEVNQGNYGAEALQLSLGVTPDGNIGPVTLAALKNRDPWELASWVIAYRALQYVRDSLFYIDGKGWMRRLAIISLAVGKNQ